MKTPKCIMTRHSWYRQGGCRENPGVWGIGGAAIQISETCRHCGLGRSKIVGDVNECGNRNHGWRYEEPIEEIEAAPRRDAQGYRIE